MGRLGTYNEDDPYECCTRNERALILSFIMAAFILAVLFGQHKVPLEISDDHDAPKPVNRLQRLYNATLKWDHLALEIDECPLPPDEFRVFIEDLYTLYKKEGDCTARIDAKDVYYIDIWCGAKATTRQIRMSQKQALFSAAQSLMYKKKE